MHSPSSSNTNTIFVKGAREHNLQNLSLEIPRSKLVVVTGVSGSGKSSLVFDTIYAEGYRKYIDGLSTKARALLEQIPRPDIDFISRPLTCYCSRAARWYWQLAHVAL